MVDTKEFCVKLQLRGALMWWKTCGGAGVLSNGSSKQMYICNPSCPISLKLSKLTGEYRAKMMNPMTLGQLLESTMEGADLSNQH